MMTKVMAITGLALLAACGSASVGERSAAAQTRSTGKPLSIAGIRIGMTVADTEAALAKDGWKVETFPGRDWPATVEEERRQQRGASTFDLPRVGIDAIQARKADEAMTISIRPVPTGGVVRDIGYNAPMAGRSADQLRSQMIQRYGNPDVTAPPQAPVEMTWCSGGERCRMAPGAMQPALSVREDVYHKLQIHLYEGVASERAWQAGVQRAAGGASPPKSSF